MITLEQVIYVIPLFGLAASLFYYALVLRNQNKTRQAQFFYGIYNRMSQADFAEAWNAFTSWEYSNIDESRKILADEQNRRYWAMLGYHFGGLGALVRMDLVPIHYVANFLPHVTRTYWEKQAPIIKGYREK